VVRFPVEIKNAMNPVEEDRINRRPEECRLSPVGFDRRDEKGRLRDAAAPPHTDSGARTHAGAEFCRAFEFHRQGNLTEAKQVCWLILSADPCHFDATHLLGIIFLQLGQFNFAERQLSSAIEINPEIASAHNNRGSALKNLGRLNESLASYENAIALQHEYPEALINRGVVLLELKRPEEALESYEGAIALNPAFSEAHFYRGNVLRALQRNEEALLAYDTAIALGRDDAVALNNRGAALRDLGRFEEALANYEEAISLNPGFAEAFNNRGVLLHELKHPKEALADYNSAIALKPDYLVAIYNRALVLSDLNRFPEAIADCEAALAIDSTHAQANGLLTYCCLQTCDWRCLDRQTQNITALLTTGVSSVRPLTYLAISNSEESNLLSARVWVAHHCPPNANPIRHGRPYRHGRIRLAYLSSDLREHAVASLITGVFEHHDKNRFETVAFSTGPDDGSEARARIVSTFDRFVDVQAMNDAEVARQMHDMEIDIAIDLNGHTRGSRTGILAFRPAPIQVNYLGYPGTTGTDYVDYIVADRFVIPETRKRYYSEKVVYLSNTYQSNDRKRRVADRLFTPTEVGLPDTGFVFCSFNNSYKIMPDVFNVWMRLLRRVDDSVLWLLGDNQHAAENLCREAEAQGISAERLVFAPRMNPEDHLARQRLASLFLDTLPYNAHTTASDALWMGLPVLTCPGHTFPGRVAASLLNAIGLPELIANSLQEYEALALALARDTASFAAIKRKLVTHRDTFPLFNAVGFTRNLEAAFTEMWRRHENGELPESFTVP
jgi:protein O-GlcNAc transferase